MVDAIKNGRLGYGAALQRNGVNWELLRLPRSLFEEGKNRLNEVFSSIKNSLSQTYETLLSTTPIDDDSATIWASSLQIDRALLVQYDALHGDGGLISDLKAAYKLSGGRLSSLSTLSLTKTRSSASLEGMIKLNPANGRKVLFHEVGHHFEFSNPDFLKMAVSYLKDRSGGERRVAKLRDITLTGYSSNETAIIDNLSHPYIGKLYGSLDSLTSTEVFSTAFEYLFDHQNGAVSIIHGDGLIEFAIGAIQGIYHAPN